MLSKIYQYAIAALALGLAIVTALLYRSKAKYQGAMRKGVEQVRETEKKATDAMVTGLNREKKARNDAKIAISNRKYFGS